MSQSIERCEVVLREQCLEGCLPVKDGGALFSDASGAQDESLFNITATSATSARDGSPAAVSETASPGDRDIRHAPDSPSSPCDVGADIVVATESESSSAAGDVSGPSSPGMRARSKGFLPLEALSPDREDPAESGDQSSPKQQQQQVTPGASATRCDDSDAGEPAGEACHETPSSGRKRSREPESDDLLTGKRADDVPHLGALAAAGPLTSPSLPHEGVQATAPPYTGLQAEESPREPRATECGDDCMPAAELNKEQRDSAEGAGWVIQGTEDPQKRAGTVLIELTTPVALASAGESEESTNPATHE